MKDAAYAAEMIGVMEEVREEFGISIAALARQSQIENKRLWCILNCKRHMRIDEFVRICFILGINPITLIPKELICDFQRNREQVIKEHGLGMLHHQLPYLPGARQ